MCATDTVFSLYSRRSGGGVVWAEGEARIGPGISRAFEGEREKGINQISAKCQPPSAAQGKNTSVTQENFPEREEQGINKVDPRRHTCEILLHLLFILLHCPKV